MALNNVTINVNGNGLGRQLRTNDSVSGLVFYSATLPSGFTTSDRIKAVYSLPEAETLGITKAAVPLIHYHVKEFFRIQPDAKLYVSINAVPASTYNFSEVTTLQNFAEGEIKQIGVVANALVFAAAQVTTLQTIADALFQAYKPALIVYGAEFSTLTVASVPTLATANAPYVVVTLAEDGGGDGKALRATLSNKSVTAVGATLAAVSKAKVSQNIGNLTSAFNLSNGLELEIPALSTDGQPVKLLSDTALSDLKDKCYLFIRKYSEYAGSYFEDSNTCTASTSDFASIEAVRTFFKAVRNVRTVLLPEIKSNIFLSAGKISETSCVHLELLASQACESMVSAGELSEFKVTINPSQDVLGTSKVVVNLSMVPSAIARNIQVNMGFTKK
ncbi:DUF2586 family protein [Rufibacter ruber]|uniref:DUF2586 family protein n=1 Tax=Rufibacter ruber TaxID=1783499 RepID=UPI0008368341|nr:DUF2586 family protein [Rufibacter ruber]